jgi:hypothetical protein
MKILTIAFANDEHLIVLKNEIDLHFLSIAGFNLYLQ